MDLPWAVHFFFFFWNKELREPSLIWENVRTPTPSFWGIILQSLGCTFKHICYILFSSMFTASLRRGKIDSLGKRPKDTGRGKEKRKEQMRSIKGRNQEKETPNTHLPPTSYSKAHQITPDSSDSHLSAPSLIKYASPHLLCPWPSNKPSFPFPPSGSGPPVQSPYSHP